MPAVLLLKLIGVWGWLKRLAGALWDFARRNPWQALSVALLVAFLWQTRQVHQWHEASDRQAAAIKTMQAASDANAAAALAQNKAWEAKSAQIAKDSEHDHVKALADARDATARYFAAHRVRREGGVCAAPSASEGNDPGQRVEVPADPDMVAVAKSDLQAFVEWVAYGVSEHNRSVDKIHAGQAVVGN